MHAPLSPQAPAEALRATLAELVDGLPPRQAAQATARLIANYRGATPTDAPVLRDRSDVVAYAAYRMPATFEADRAALGALADAVPQWTPSGHTDIGGGTGAAVWAAADIWPDPADGAAPRPVTVLDWAEPALALGRELAARAPSAALRDARWRRARIDAALDVPPTGLVTVSYVLGELTPADRAAVVDAAAGAAEVVAVVEPGTPDGYRRIIEARDRLV
ncbi:small ribosomal subunit Rsm22 family protein, partial [Streptomyces albidoflavus]